MKYIFNCLHCLVFHEQIVELASLLIQALFRRECLVFKHIIY